MNEEQLKLQEIKSEISTANDLIRSISNKHKTIFNEYKKAMNELNIEIKILRDLKLKEKKILSSIEKKSKKEVFSKKIESLNNLNWDKLLSSENEDNARILKNVFKNSAIQHSGLILHTLQNSVRINIHKNISNAEILFVETVINKIKDHFIPFERGKYGTPIHIEFFAKVYRNYGNSYGDSYSLIFTDNSWRILYRDDSVGEPFKSLNHALKMFKKQA